MTAVAFLALAFSVIVPPGVMTTSRAGGGVLVICTGHGPLILDRSGDQKAPPGKSKASAACPFAVNITPPLPSVVAASRRTSPVAVVTASLAGDQSPGRGLAAPPPPAIGPPASI
jgi:hypothetical protein